MLSFTARRLFLLFFTLWLASTLVFVLTSVAPGDVGRAILGPFASKAAVDALNEQLGMNRPVLARYADWLIGILQGDWGRSLNFDVPVLRLVLERTGRSLTLALATLVILGPIAIGLGLAAAVRQGGAFDRAVTTLGLMLGALPEFVTGVFMIAALGLWLRLLPIQALTPPGAGIGARIEHLLMPAICLALLLFTYLFRMMRASTIEVLAADSTRTAVLKGLPPRLVFLRHVAPNAILPTITVLGAQLGWTVGGLVVVETLFRYPGLGSLAYFAASHRDLPLLIGCVMMIALIYGIGNFLADLAQFLLNPRMRRAA
jgi:peptide/nickel transport system permease protein